VQNNIKCPGKSDISTLLPCAERMKRRSKPKFRGIPQQTVEQQTFNSRKKEGSILGIIQKHKKQKM